MYLQHDDLHAKSLDKDTIVRTYGIDTFNYKIQPNDIVSVTFESLSEKEFDFLSAQQANVNNINLAGGSALLVGELVDERGEISLPGLGKVKIAGLTVFQAQEKLQSLASAHITAPVSKIRLLNFRFTILGEVNKEGSVTLMNNRVSMLEAIGLSGGLSDLADRKNVKLLRQINGQTQVQYIDLLSEEFVSSPYFYVHQNDVIIVPALRQRPFRKYFGQNLALVVSALSLLLLSINLYQTN